MLGKLRHLVLVQHNSWRSCHTRFRKRPMHGARYLLDKNRVFEFNAWDDVEWDDEQESHAKQKVEANSVVKYTSADIAKYETHADKYWNAFYDVHANRFFKDRHWLFTEYPELKECAARPTTVFEVGCGVGNTIFPILQYTLSKSGVFVYGSDFSAKAVEILREVPEYDAKRCNVFVLDATQTDWEVPFAENSIDIGILIFVLSAINPDKFRHVLKQFYRYMKPGGLMLFRDYGRYDLAQLRFKPGRCIGDNFYARGDGTRVYFFTQEEVANLFHDAGFEEVQNKIDRRLQVNRGRMIKMYRVWIQAKYRKPLETS